ncbi:MAG: RNA methyltransferase [Gammaproteobacteria bacterium]|nr:RNA methyltransferase [Gammaproteobacteria bacterium]
MNALQSIRIVLVEPTHPGNIGAVARAIKTMGLQRLVLVNPKKYPHYEASKRAAGAEDVLDSAVVVPDLAAAIGNCTLVLGTSVRDREVSWPTVTPDQAAQMVLEHLPDDDAVQGPREVAVLFGRESSGLSNAELELCQQQIRIPANDEYSSLNLASAVQIICYEMRMAARRARDAETATQQGGSAVDQRRQPATRAQQDAHLAHLESALQVLDFVKSKPPTVLLRKLARLYNKAQLTTEEVQILRGILSAIEDRVGRS